MTRPPILPGTRAYDAEGDPWRVDGGMGNTTNDPHRTERMYGPLTPDYGHAGTCGELMTWCHRELQRLVAETHKPLRPHLNAARVALNEARPWDGPSVERAVKAVCEVLP